LIVGCAVGANAHQISDVPRWVLARLARVHGRFGALRALFIAFTTAFVPVDGPSVEMNATRSVFAATANGPVWITLVSEVWFTFTTFVIVGAEPSEMTIATALPNAALVLPAGVWLITLPPGTEVLAALVTVTVKPALVSAVVAAAWVWPTTFGTVTGGCPLDA